MSAEHPSPTAVALRYRRGEADAPAVVASAVANGTGALAERIAALARDHGIAVREEPDLIALLSACQLGEAIPADLCGVVAELLAYFYLLNDERGSATQLGGAEAERARKAGR